MPADQTPRRCAYNSMMTRVVAGNAPDDGAFETTFGRGGRGGQRCWKQDNQDERQSYHHSLHPRLDRVASL